MCTLCMLIYTELLGEEQLKNALYILYPIYLHLSTCVQCSCREGTWPLRRCPSRSPPPLENEIRSWNLWLCSIFLKGFLFTSWRVLSLSSYPLFNHHDLLLLFIIIIIFLLIKTITHLSRWKTVSLGFCWKVPRPTYCKVFIVNIVKNFLVFWASCLLGLAHGRALHIKLIYSK